jgi:hypothetical protein
MEETACNDICCGVETEERARPGGLHWPTGFDKDDWEGFYLHSPEIPLLLQRSKAF